MSNFKIQVADVRLTPEELERIQKRLDDTKHLERRLERFQMFFSKLSHLAGIDSSKFYEIINSENDFDIMVRNDMAKTEIHMREIK